MAVHAPSLHDTVTIVSGVVEALQLFLRVFRQSPKLRFVGSARSGTHPFALLHDYAYKIEGISNIVLFGVCLVTR